MTRTVFLAPRALHHPIITFRPLALASNRTHFETRVPLNSCLRGKPQDQLHLKHSAVLIGYTAWYPSLGPAFGASPNPGSITAPYLRSGIAKYVCLSSIMVTKRPQIFNAIRNLPPCMSS